MKTKMNYFKTAVMAIALFGAAQVSAQYPNPIVGKVDSPDDLEVGKVTFDGTTESFTLITDGTGNNATENTGFYLPTNVPAMSGPSVTSMTMHASEQDSSGEPFVSFNWYEVSSSGAETFIANTITDQVTPANNTYTFDNLTSGYHKFRVRGVVGGATCESNEYEDMIVFVLPQLDVVPSVTGTLLTYCEGDAPTGVDEIELSTAVTADYSDATGISTGYPKPGETDAATDFALTYEWHAVNTTTSNDQVIGTNSPTAIMSLTTPGTYTFYVKVKYVDTIRDPQSRTYVTYEGATSGTGGTVIVTETPGTPTITVTNVTD